MPITKEEELCIVVLASGRGSNFKAIANAINAGKCNAKILALISDNPDAKALSIAKNANIPTHIVERKNFDDDISFDNAIFSIIEKYSPDLVILAGYMRILRSPKIFEKYHNRIINVHPALLPKYKGLDAQKQAFDAKEKISGLTIHIVDENLDGGPIIYQEKIDISNCKTSEEVAKKILMHEHIAFPMVINKIGKGQIRIW
ncbi:MAG: phosphoribosylglycinamide formyltransferase [Candidatus Micrarchaeota archaeon]